MPLPPGVDFEIQNQSLSVWEKSPQQSVAVFVAASLPSGISIAKINRDLKVRFDCGITAEFLSTVGRECLERYFGENVIEFANRFVHGRGRAFGHFNTDVQTRFPLDKRSDTAFGLTTSRNDCI